MILIVIRCQWKLIRSSLTYLLSKIEAIWKLSIKIIIIAVLFRGKQGQSRSLSHPVIAAILRCHWKYTCIYIEYYNRNAVETAYFETLSTIFICLKFVGDC